MNFTMAASKQFLKESAISIKNYGKRATYNQELTKIVKYFNKTIGHTWDSVKRRKQQVKWGNKTLDQDQLPWIKIRKAIGDFNNYFEHSSHFFKIDHTFNRN